MKLSRRLNLPEAIGLSLSIICPSVTAAFNVSLVAGATGAAAPLAFAIGTLAMTFIALSFMAFTHRVAHAGSAYGYVAHTFGNRWGFVAGCALLLTYVGFATGLGALVGSFTAAALKGLGVEVGVGWVAIGGASILIAWWLAYRDMRIAGRLMLALEGLVVLAIIGLGIGVLLAVRPDAAQVAASFRPSAQYNGWPGLGFGMVFCILSFAGFEGAATLGEETLNPRRSIPVALLGTVLGSGAFFVFISFVEVVGFGAPGTGGIAALAKSEAPLNDLALRFASPQVAIGLDLAAAASCFASVLGALAAAGRILFAMGRGGLSQALAVVHPLHGTPAPALHVVALLILCCFVSWAPFVGAGNFYSYVSTIAVLALILVYIGVGGAEMLEAWRERRAGWTAVCMAGPLLLGWVLYRNVYPIPEFPNNLWPYVALLWVAVAWWLTRLRPAVIRAPLEDVP
jgi:amino acid transporter